MILRPSTRPAERALDALLKELDTMIEACDLLSDVTEMDGPKEIEERQESLSEEVAELRDRIDEAMESSSMIPVVKEELGYIAENVRRAAETLLSLASLLVSFYEDLEEEDREKLDEVIDGIAKIASGVRESVELLNEDVRKAAEHVEKIRSREEDVRSRLRALMLEAERNGRLAPIALEIERALEDMDRALDGVNRIKVRFLG
ncbi:hypothetical protein [Methanopyrus sp. SNP6]|uniref:hypothetical protein n=1 Tax=Methanopyrus sp. SNP6 TaxID=1937005 RepID=UPI0011E5D290|nr:hypothetical protein [Methanopyrus sp. SNP6]